MVDDGRLEVLNSSHVTFEGLTWTNRSTLRITGSNHVRLTRNHFRLTEESALDRVLVQGAGSHHNRIDHNHFRAVGPRVDNVVRCNTFRASQETVTHRHGNRGSLHGNFFFGEGKAGTGGIRLYGEDHRVYNNHFEGLTGSGYDAALLVAGRHAFVTDDVDGQRRVGVPDVGADERSAAPITRGPLRRTDVGPNAR